ncbi:transglutaminaseTgpA domain-containing protein [Demequina aurantiaca]|uniref:transglutaminase family protein n=1 Tax=Demequina aurantiaca TaxID=676200 RepID=UPI003D34AFCC
MTRRGRAAPTVRAANPSWLVTLLIALAALLGLAGLDIVIDYDTWVRTVIATVLAVAALVAFTRRRTASKWIPTAVGAAGALLLLIWNYAERADGSHHVLPTPAALRDLSSAIAQGIHHAEVSTIPVVATPGFAALMAASVLIIFLAAEHLSVSWGLTATAGILLLLPWLPAAILQHQVSVRYLVLAIACWVGAMALTRIPSSQPRAANPVAATATVGAVVAAAVLLAPLAVGAPGWGVIPRFEAPSGLDGTTRLNLALDLRSSLTTKSGTTVLVYATSSGEPTDTLRLYTLTDFDGNSWERDPTTSASVPADAGVLWPTAVQDWDTSERERVDIQVRGLSEKNLPIPSAPRTVDVGSTWFYYADQDEVSSDQSTTKDLFYSVVTDLNYHQRDVLVATQAEIDGGADQAVDPSYLELSPAIDAERMSTLARDVTERADTRYDQAMAIQQYLRSPLNFTYDTTVPPTGDDSVSEFLDSGSGYCVQFGTAMVVLARSLDIPARLAVGFLGGAATDDNTFAVRGSDAHAWPELYFAEEGWVRFEPTPAIQTGAPPTYADPTAGAGQSTGTVPDSVRPDQAGDLPNPVVQDATGGAQSDANGPGVGWWIAAGLLLAAGTVGATRWWRRRPRHHLAVTEPERAWRILGENLGTSIGWPSALTPLEAAAHIEEKLRPLHAHLSESGEEALARVTAAVSDSRYRLGEAEDPGNTGLEADARAVASEVERAVKGKPVAR